MKAIDRQDLARVVKEMGRLGDRFILIGGCAPWFLLDAAFVPQVRPTLDLDFVVEVVTHLEYTRLEEKLRKIGFRHDTRPGAPRCRWLLGDIQVDVQSASSGAADFGSPWFADAVLHAEEHRLADELPIKVIGPVHFLATKLDAFFSRGASDYVGSRDLEDIVAILDGCSRLEKAMHTAPPMVVHHVGTGLRRLRGDPSFLDAIQGHISPESPPGAVLRLLQRIDEIIESASSASR